jgi:hypothetical protein
MLVLTHRHVEFDIYFIGLLSFIFFEGKHYSLDTFTLSHSLLCDYFVKKLLFLQLCKQNDSE